MKKENKPSLIEASIMLVIIIGIGVIALKIAPAIAILSAIGIVMIYTAVKRLSFETIHEGIVLGITPGIVPIFIFILVGSLIAVWIQAGIIPTLMVVGFKIISVKWFVPSVFVVCALVGSAFTVMSTIGIAFFGIGTTIGLNPALVVGAIVSGAVFGDKMSTLSESTNLTAAVVDADLFKHIKNLMLSTVPAFIISFILFAILGNNHAGTSLNKITKVESILQQNFSISFWAIIPIALMFICAWRKIPAIVTILLNIGVAIIMIFIQDPSTKAVTVGNVINSGFVSHTGNRIVKSINCYHEVGLKV